METDDQDRVSRRRFLHSIGIAGVVGASGSLLAACGGSDDSSGDSSSTSASADQCTDVSDLSDQELKQRKQMVNSLEYVDESQKEGKTCSNCQLYVESEYGDGCGGCTLFPGPVNANGYCNSWAPAS